MHAELMKIIRNMKLSQAAVYAIPADDISRIKTAMTVPRVSFEFFPPKSLEASFRLWETLNVLAPAPAGFRFGDLWCGRHDAGADP
jgi:hypothetical protein